MAKTFRALTRLEIRKAKPGESITEHGISFERLTDGDGRYSINVMVDRVRIHRVVGKESEGVTRTQAEQFIEKVRTDARHDRLTLPRGRKTAMSFADAAVKYLTRMREGTGKNIVIKDRHLRQHLIPFFGSMPLGKVSQEDVERYSNKRLGDVAQIGGDRRRPPRTEGKLTSAGTVNRELATLSHMLSCAVDSDWVRKKPRIVRHREGKGRITFLTPVQIQRLLDAALDSDNIHLYAFVLVAVATSLRRAEVLSIRRENIDIDRRVIFVKTKTGPREQPITARLGEFLVKYLRESVPASSPWLFPSSASASGHAVNIDKAFRKAVAAAGMNPKEVVRHTLRHTAVTHLVQAGVDLPTVMRVSGHKTLAMVQRYSHQDDDHIKAAMDKLQVRIGAEVHQNYTPPSNSVVAKGGIEPPTQGFSVSF